MQGQWALLFLPTRSSLGSDIIKKWGFSSEFRKNNLKLPDLKLVEMENPFKNWCDTKKIVLVPAINPKVVRLL